MRLALVVALCACGRIGFDARSDAAASQPDAPDVGYFLSPTGDDGNAGTRHEPWLTFAHALATLKPGDQLNLLDGDYDAQGPSGWFHADCTFNAVSGTAAAPIIVRADHPRRAHLFDKTSPLDLDNCANWQIEDLWLEGLDDPNDKIGPVAWVHASSGGVTLRGLLVVHPNRHNNNNAIEVGNSANITVEDCEAYDYAFDAFVMYASNAITFQRLYANGRGALDLDRPSGCPGGDRGAVSYYNAGGTIADVVVENICDRGFLIEAGYDGTANTGIGDFHVIRSSIALGPGTQGFLVDSDCESAMPCSNPDGIATDNTIVNSVALGFAEGFQSKGVGTQFQNTSSFTSTTAGIDLTVLSTTGGYSPTAYVASALVQGAPIGINSQNQLDWSVMTSNVWAATTPYMPNDSHVTGSTNVDPMLGSCEVYQPVASSIGADIRVFSSNGAPYWRPDGTFAACGAVVPGVNDDPAKSCIGVHQRLNVGTNGCALP